jgi:apolipoprotein N-acyltransferase
VNLLYFLLSLVIVAFGQPAWSQWLSPLAATIGYALFWKVACAISFSKKRFWLSALWFALVQLVQLSWMTSMEFHGVYILLVYVALAVWLGLQFGLVTLFIDKIPMVATAACWTLLEWARLYVLCGFSWNPLGLTLTAFTPSLQAASLFGVLGLSFLVVLTNLAFWKRRFAAACVLALFPYVFGFIQLSWFHTKVQKSETLTVGLVQTGLLPSEKILIDNRLEDFIPPTEQWRRIFTLLQRSSVPLDLVVLPEFAVPFSAEHSVYPMSAVQRVAGLGEIGFEERKKISNLDFAKLISKLYQTDVIAGLEAEKNGRHYSSAFYYPKAQGDVRRYDKQILVPLAEYVPFEWVKMLTTPYGITEFFTHGKKPKLFSAKMPIAASICYEETFSYLMRKSRLKGAELFVNLTNDGWYPNSRLGRQHFDHAKVRTVENGVPLVRACNTGFTAAIDCLGNTVAQLADERRPDLLVAHVPTYHFATLYSLVGDLGIVVVALLSLGACFYMTKLHGRWS